MDITPDTHLINALGNQNLKWIDMLGELIDNSLDSGANQVEIVASRIGSLRVTDDGCGCPDVKPMLTLGGRHTHRTTKLGRYGIGLKDVALNLKGITEIQTTHKGMCRTLVVDWNKLTNDNGRWIVPDPTISNSLGSSGTVIEFRNTKRKLTLKSETLAENIGFVFTPALLNGKQITFKGGQRKPITCTPYRLPVLSNVVEAEFEVGGKGVRLRAGIVPDGFRNTRAGFSYSFGHRIIATTSLGSGTLSVGQVAGFVELSGEWGLSKNKNGISAEHEEELSAAVFDRCKEMLLCADQRGRTIESSAFNTSVSEKLQAAIGGVGCAYHREKRDCGEGVGSILPQGTPRKRKKAAKVSNADGPVARAAKGGIRIDWKAFDSDTIGSVDLNGNVVWLNREHPWLVRLRETSNTDATTAICVSMFLKVAAEHDGIGRQLLRGVDSIDYLPALGSVLATIPMEDEA